MVAAEGQAANAVPCPERRKHPRRHTRYAAMEYEWLSIDLPLTALDLIEQAMVVPMPDHPCPPGFFDVIAVQTVTWMCRKHRKPFAFVLSAVDGRYKV